MVINRIALLTTGLCPGFSNQFIFSRAFKKQFGVAPKKYNSQHAPAT